MVCFRDIFVSVLLMRLSSVALRLVDLSYRTDSQMITWPINPSYNFTILDRRLHEETGTWFENNFFAQPEHMGTHLDAPAHFGKGSLKMHQIQLKDLYGPGVIINVKDKVASNPDYGVTIGDVKAWEEKNGRIPYGAVVLMNSGWFYHYPDWNKVFNTQTIKDTTSYHFPGWLGNTTQWLVDNRHINILGSDTPSFDRGQSKKYLTHKILAKNNIVGAENIANLDKVPEHGSTIYMPALNIYDGSGAPARAFATYDDGVYDGNGARRITLSFSLVLLLVLAFILN